MRGIPRAQACPHAPVTYSARASIAFALVLSLAGASAAAAPATLPHPAGTADDFLDANAQAPLPVWSETPDYTALRLAYARRRDFDERCEGTPADEFEPLLDDKRFQDAAAVAERWLQRCPVDARMHQWAAFAYYQGGMQAEADVHTRWHHGLVESIIAGADGLTPTSPWRVISIMEEYIVLQHLGLKRVRQSILEGDPPIDAIEVTDEQGNASSRYFDPRWHLRRLRGLLIDGDR